jgi:hypothetical protein
MTLIVAPNHCAATIIFVSKRFRSVILSLQQKRQYRCKSASSEADTANIIHSYSTSNDKTATTYLGSYIGTIIDAYASFTQQRRITENYMIETELPLAYAVSLAAPLGSSTSITKKLRKWVDC